ncbi:MAG: hypothetical protein OES57_02885 [Acidimicrobiia bacterium]|nr:hypothetical protein [Acidimicrobiia bacterium]
MTLVRFNHMELTYGRGELTPGLRAEIDAFYGDVFGWDGRDVPVMNQQGHLLRVDDEQFILLLEADQPISSPGYDHLGLLMEDRVAVDATLERCRAWQQRDERVQVKEYDDLDTPNLTVHAFYVRYLLPIWFDVQVLEPKPVNA